MKDDLFALVEAAAALNAATDGMESLRPQRQAVLDALSNLSRRPEPAAAEPVVWREDDAGTWIYHDAASDLGEHIAKYQQKAHGVTLFPLYAHPPAPDQAQPIDDEALVEKLARALAIADGIEICSDASYRHSSYGIRARAILPIIRECLK